MIKVLANKALAFTRGEKDSKGYNIRVITTVGFCELPDWAAQTPYFEAAVADKSLIVVTSSSDSENVLKEQEKLAVIKAEIAEMEEKRERMAALLVGIPVVEDGKELVADNTTKDVKTKTKTK